MWHYTEGIRNWDPVWPAHGIRILPGPSPLWLDATGKRLPVPLFPGFDTLGTLEHLGETGYDYSWFILNRRVIGREFALSGSEQNPDLTDRKPIHFLRSRLGRRVPPPVAAFIELGRDFVVDAYLESLVRKMNTIGHEPLLEPKPIREEIAARDRQLGNKYAKDSQIVAIENARRYWPDRLSRVTPPHRVLDPDAGPLIAVRLNILTRKTLGGIETNLDGQVLGTGGEAVPGLYAAGEAAGFGGGGMHGYRSLEGTFLGGCLHSGLRVGRALAS